MSSSAHVSVLASASPGSPSGSAAAHNATGSAKASPQGGANTDRMIYLARDEAYPHQLWWLVAAFIGTIALFRFASWALAKCSRRAPLSRGQKTTAADAAAAETGAGGASSPAGRGFALRNVPTAVINAYRVVAFRWTLEIGQSYTLNFAEVFVTVAYIVALYTWEFTNSESLRCSHRLLACIDGTSATDLEGGKLDIKYWGARAGILAVSQTPIITALGTKNNIVACESSLV